MNKTCGQSMHKGNVKSWDDFRSAGVNGDVEMVHATFCQMSVLLHIRLSSLYWLLFYLFSHCLLRKTEFINLSRELGAYSQKTRSLLLLLTYKALNDLAPKYISELINIYVPRRNLRSAQSKQLVLESFNLRTCGFWAFSHAAHLEWNSLPRQVRFDTSLFSFKNQLKTHLFENAYDNYLYFQILRYIEF